jgi:hypothetical protein
MKAFRAAKGKPTVKHRFFLPLDELSVGTCQSGEQAVSSSAHTWKQNQREKQTRC